MKSPLEQNVINPDFDKWQRTADNPEQPEFRNWLNGDEAKKEFIECLHLLKTDQPGVVRYLMVRAFNAGLEHSLKGGVSLPSKPLPAAQRCATSESGVAGSGEGFTHEELMELRALLEDHGVDEARDALHKKLCDMTCDHNATERDLHGEAYCAECERGI